MKTIAAVAALTSMAAMAQAHSLTPLTPDEIRSAARIFRASGRMPQAARFSLLTLDEPPKDQVLRAMPSPRRAFAVIYDRAANRTYEGVADLGTAQVVSWNPIPGAQPAVNEVDSGLADRIVRADSRWAAALRARNVRDADVFTVAWPAGYFGVAAEQGQRIVRVTPYLGTAGANFYGHPIEGIAVHVNLTTGRILEFVDIDRNAPVSRANSEMSPRLNQPLRMPPAPLEISQPQGVSYRIEDGEVRWQKWRFRFSLHPREGLVVHTVGYEDGGRVRQVMYRGSLAEMVVPYGDPSAAWYFRNTFDVGELGLGLLASPLQAGVDCPQNCQVFDAVVAGENGEPRTIRGAVALFERDARIAWKHGDETRRARDLVLTYMSEAGNYEYGFEWIFHQDGALEVKVLLTGIMSVKGVADGVHEPYSHLVAKNIAAVHHQHFFCFRLDLDVDGQPNRVIEMNSLPEPNGPKNPYGGAFTMQETVLATEKQAQRRMSLDASRKWIVESAGQKNALGHATGFALLPGENAIPFAQPDSWIRKRAGFLNAHFWATPFNPVERYPAGDYPNLSQGGDGLPRWTAAGRAIDSRDVVVWYTMGITHNPRPEDWPVMPVHEAGFKLVPWGFFTKNPAMDLTPVR